MEEVFDWGGGSDMGRGDGLWWGGECEGSGGGCSGVVSMEDEEGKRWRGKKKNRNCVKKIKKF